MVLAICTIASSIVYAGTITLSLGSYDSQIYNQGTLNIPVTVTSTNISGNVDITLAPKSGLGCSTCTISKTFTGATNEQQTATFTLTATQTGTYNPPFISIGAISGSTQATALTSGSQVVVVEQPTWTKDLSVSSSSITEGDSVTVTLTLTPSGTFQGVIADLTLPSGLTLVSGADPRTIGTISGASSTQWVVESTSTGSKTISVGISATSPQKSASDNTKSVSVTVNAVAEENNSSSSSGGGGGGGAAGTITSYEDTKTLQTLNAGVNTVTLKNALIPFTQFDMDLKNPFINKSVVLTVKLLKAGEQPVFAETLTGKVYNYLEVNKTNITDDAIKSVIINFKVPKSWFTQNNISFDGVSLYRYTGNKWVLLSTLVDRMDNTSVYFKATSPGFSYFAIAAKPAPGTAVARPTTTQTPNTTATPSSTTPKVTIDENETNTSGIKYITNKDGTLPKTWVWTVVIVILALVVGGYMFLRNRKKRKSASSGNQSPPQ